MFRYDFDIRWREVAWAVVVLLALYPVLWLAMLVL